MPKTLFTVENAAEMGRRSAEARKRQAERPQESPQSVQPTEQAPLPTDDYLQRKLKRVRKQIDLLDTQLEEAESSKDIQAIATALQKLWEVEGWLSNRHKPGLTKPIAGKQSRHPVSVEPVELPSSNQATPQDASPS